MFTSPKRSLLLALVLVPAISAAPIQGQLAENYSELDGLVRSADVVHAMALEDVNNIVESPDAADAAARLEEHLTDMMTMSMMEMMQGGMNEMEMGYFGDRESAVFAELAEIADSGDAADEADGAYGENSVLPARAAAVIRRGRDFHHQIFDIYTDDSIGDKTAAVNAAVREYLSDTENSLPTQPKNANLMFSHQYASAFKAGFPEISGLVWASNWLRLAALDPLMSSPDMADMNGGVDAVIERFESKFESMPGMPGMSMMALPTEMPTTAAIAPLLQSRHPNAAVILDNLSMLETVVADLLVHPGVDDRETAITNAVANFTNRSTDIVPRRDYLLASLRAGIYAQGGPAFGGLAQSERNRSRQEMEMGPHVMPGMN